MSDKYLIVNADLFYNIMPEEYNNKKLGYQLLFNHIRRVWSTKLTLS